MNPRYTLAALVLVAGCAQHPALSLSEECRLGAWLALHVAKEEPPLSVPSPDKPDKGDICPACDGVGKVGDGTVMFKCNDCNGTGRKPAAAFDTPASAEAFEVGEVKAEVEERYRKAAAAKAAKPEAPQAAPGPERYAVPPADGRTYRKVCRAGSCAWEPVQ